MTIFSPRHDIAGSERITPMHAHDPRLDHYVETATGRPLSVAEATHIASRDAPPGVDRVDRKEGRGFSRRWLLRSGTAAFGALAAVSAFPRMSFAAGSPGDLIVTVFLRGGMDGLSAVVPINDAAYYVARPQIAVPEDRTFALNSQFGMNKHLSALKPLWDAQQMAVVVGSGNPAITRSHFEDQNSCERAAPASVRSGWLGRHLASISSEHGTFRAISMGNQVALSITSTAFQTLSMSGVSEFDVYAWGSMRPRVLASIEKMYAGVGGLAQEQATATMAAVSGLADLRSLPYTPENGAVYPDNRFGKGLMDIARLAKAGIGLEAATIDSGDWDMHSKLGLASNDDDWFSRSARGLASSVAAFAADLGQMWNRTTVVLMSEFGRRVDQNGDLGLDHGQGNVLWVLGGGIRGGVYGTQPELTPENRVQGDVPVTTDYRLVLSEIVSNRLGGGGNLAAVFPGYTPGPMLGITRPRS